AWCDARVSEAIAVHTAGTCLRNDGTPRTLGGCFFYLAFEALPTELRVKIFGHPQKNTKAKQGTPANVLQPPVVTEWNGEMSTAKLKVILKVNELPRGVFTVQNGQRRFHLDCGGRAVTVTLKTKAWNKLEAAARDWPQWVASISGQMGASTEKGF